MIVWMIVALGAVVGLAAVAAAVFMAGTDGGLAELRRPRRGAEAWLAARGESANCHLTTRGRVTGEPHEIEIWFAARGATAYLLSGQGAEADWVRNLRAEPRVRLRIGDETREASARFVEDAAEDRRARELLAAKHQGWRPGEPFSEWAETALLVAIDLDPV